MPIQLEKVVPWGRLMEEYVGMFALDERDLGKTILGCGDGPASFNVEWNARGGSVISCDPIYVFSPEQIRQRVHETRDYMIQAVREARDTFVWDTIRSPEDLERRRLAAMEAFLADFGSGQSRGRYVPAGLPHLPFADDAFDLALSSHLLFLYAEQLSLDFHVQSLIEMCRVAREVRVFPLLMIGNRPSPHVPRVKDRLAEAGFKVEVRRVDYEFQKGGNEMMVIG